MFRQDTAAAVLIEEGRTMRLFWKSIAVFWLILGFAAEGWAVSVDMLKPAAASDIACGGAVDEAAVLKAAQQWIKELNSELAAIGQKDEKQIIQSLLNMDEVPMAKIRFSDAVRQMEELTEPVLKRALFAKNKITASDKKILALFNSLCLAPDMDEGMSFLRLDYPAVFRRVHFSPEARAFADVLVLQPLCSFDLGGEEYYMIWSQVHIAEWAVQLEKFLRANPANPYAPDAVKRYHAMIDLMLFQALPPRDKNGFMYDRWNWWKKEMLGDIAKKYQGMLTGRLAEEFIGRVDANGCKVPKDLKQRFAAEIDAEFASVKADGTADGSAGAQNTVAVPNEVLYFEGSGAVNGKIPVAVWFDVKNGLVYGEIVYTNTKAKKPICLLGREKEDGSLFLYEMLPNGDISGTIAGTLVNGVLSGTWHGRPQRIEKSEGEYEYKKGKTFSIVIFAAERTHAPFSWEFDAKNASGTYSYSLGDNCDDGTVFLQINNDGTVSYRLIGLTGAPYYRTACFPEDALAGETALAKLLGNKIRIEEDEMCAIELELYNDFLVSKYAEGKDCRYRVGNGATAEGLFLKRR